MTCKAKTNVAGMLKSMKNPTDIIKTSKAVMWVPTEVLDMTETPKILQIQNLWLKTKEWKIINS
jgi:hypothetical protein